MGISDSTFGALTPWLVSLDELETWLDQTQSRADQTVEAATLQQTLDTLRADLSAMRDGRVGIPAEVPSGSSSAAKGLESFARAAAGAPAATAIRSRRLAVLRLGVWRALRAWSAVGRPGSDDVPKLDDLMVWFGQLGVRVPPGVGPSLRYAAGESAADLFNQLLRQALQALGQRYDSLGTQYANAANQPAFDGTGVAVDGWSGAWTMAIAAVYLDCLMARGDGKLEPVLRSLWKPDEDKTRFRPPNGLVVLPTRQRDIHLDLWVDVVVAQALAHAAARWGVFASGTRWHRVAVDMHDLTESVRGSRALGDMQHVYRGMCVKLLYQAVFIERLYELLAVPSANLLTDGTAASKVTPMPMNLQVDLPPIGSGQVANLEVIIRWREKPRPADMRFSAPLPLVELDAKQQAVLQRWHQKRPVRCAMRADPDALSWQPAIEGQCLMDDNGRELLALGHALLWRAVGESAFWMEVSLAVRVGGRWRLCRPQMVDEWFDGALHCWLLLDEATDSDILAVVDALRLAMRQPQRVCWAFNPVGLGVFVMAGVDLDPA